jgi:hypothetical protein
MKKTILSTAITALALTTTMGVQAEGFDQVVKDATADLNFRYRVESSDVDNSLDAALANTLKSRLTIKTGEVAGFSVLVEGDNVLHITDDFTDSENGNTTHNLVKDPETTQLNQAYLQYKGFDSTIKAGNQRINLDNQRHVGGVAFRQDEATFDAVSVTNKSVENTTVFAAVANNLNSITNANTEDTIVLVNVKYQVNPDLATTGFFYQLDDDTTVGQTMGVRATGVAADIKYEAELARQTNDISDHAPLYVHLSASKKLGSVNVKAGFESLGSDEDAGTNVNFTTPLGTNHKFLGWSDVYLKGAGANGIQDIYANAVTKVSGVKLVAQLHKFDAAEGSADLGTEIGFLAAKKIKNYGISLKLAQFIATADSEAMSKRDTTKVWLTGTAKF